jgi:hypothetical protein
MKDNVCVRLIKWNKRSLLEDQDAVCRCIPPLWGVPTGVFAKCKPLEWIMRTCLSSTLLQWAAAGKRTWEKVREAAHLHHR